ncbi:hypothetical protein KCP76_15495 [Salmonella enterica subsp. enterica serovar Weltevreden]|nr:hypothetical protein KCP76_15495 [Salmonella enterica subsp. enterica serovar Weltevreden]
MARYYLAEDMAEEVRTRRPILMLNILFFTVFELLSARLSPPSWHF